MAEREVPLAGTYVLFICIMLSYQRNRHKETSSFVYLEKISIFYRGRRVEDMKLGLRKAWLQLNIGTPL